MFMAKLNHLVDIAGLKTAEVAIFYAAQRMVFPEISEDKEAFN
jgi:hypothetical protein